MSEKIAIGIDLGTTFCCVAAIRDGKAVIIPNEVGSDITPSYVAFTDKERLIGIGAKNQAIRNPSNTVYDAKRLIGKMYSDSVIQNEKENKPFKIVDNKGRPQIQVNKGQEISQYYPEEISGMLLAKLRRDAEKYFNEEIVDAVIAVPASFTNCQRQCTIDAGNFAGLNVLRLLNEPTAAAIAYGLDRNCPEGKNILVFDLGGGTFDVSIITIRNGVFEVLSSVGDPHLGGQDFDACLINLCIDEFTKSNDKNIRSSPKALTILSRACEEAKKSLSSMNTTDIIIECLYENEDFHTTVSRRQFEFLCEKLFHRTTEIMKRALEDANLIKADIDDVVLAGGSTRIPHICDILKSFFDGKAIQTTINANYAIAQGAATLADSLLKNEDENELVLVEKTSVSLGVQRAGGKMEVLIPKNSNMPCTKKKRFSTNMDFKTEVVINVYEGENELVRENNQLGKFTLKGIPPAPKYTPQIDVEFRIDENGILHVSATELTNDVIAHLTVDLSQMNMDNQEREQIMIRGKAQSRVAEFGSIDKKRKDSRDRRSDSSSSG